VRSILVCIYQVNASPFICSKLPSLKLSQVYKDAVHIQIGAQDALTGNSDIFQIAEFHNSDADKQSALYDRMSGDSNPKARYLVFCNTKRDCAWLHATYDFGFAGRVEVEWGFYWMSCCTYKVSVCGEKWPSQCVPCISYAHSKSHAFFWNPSQTHTGSRTGESAAMLSTVTWISRGATALCKD